MELTGKSAIVIGGSQGIGEAVATQLAKEGAHVTVVGSSSVPKAQKVVDAIMKAGGKASADAADVTDFGAVGALMDRVAEAQGRIDILVNCAGVFYPTPADAPDRDGIDRMIDINLKGTIYSIDHATRHLEKNGGKIVNIASCAGVMGLKGYAVYCATKAAIMMLTRTLALELAPKGINVNAIAPGNTESPMNEDIRTDPKLKPFLDSMAEKTPSGRTYSLPQDMADLASFLVSGKARAMHGSTVLMDEGFTAGM